MPRAGERGLHLGINFPDEAMRLRIVDARMVGPDVRVTARFGD